MTGPARSAFGWGRLAAAAVLAVALPALGGRRVPEPPPLDPSRPLEARALTARAAVEKDPGSAEARVALGNAYLELGMPEEALGEFEEAARIERDYSAAWNNQGVAEELLGNRGAAAASFRQAVLADPRNAEAHWNLGRMLEMQRDFNGSIEHFKAALRLRPELGDPGVNPRARHSRLLVTAGLALYRDRTGGALPAQGPAGESGLVRLTATPTPSPARETTGPPAPAPAASPSPSPAQTPIVLGPGSVPSSPASGTRPPGDGPRSGRGGVRRGGPAPPRPAGGEP